MDLAKLLDELGYADSPHFLRRGGTDFATAPDFGHIFRHAQEQPCHLEGVYTLSRSTESKNEPIVPVVYVCRADSENVAADIHRLVWNQDVVPFVLVHSPLGVRLYSGFCYQPRRRGVESGVLTALIKFNAISEIAESFHADAIDSGQLWRDRGQHVTPEKRVDWNLLDNLQKLDRWLQSTGGLEKDVSHALIGKYVYLRYLRDRDILSDRKLKSWGLEATAIFGRAATRTGLANVTEQLDEWLNGRVFPLKLRGKDAPSDEHIMRVAATFHGDEIVGDHEWQLHLDFQAYDFSYIPIETLSVIYEQFLHAPKKDGTPTKGKEAAAYYTPIPVVNFMLGELESRKPLERGMKVADFACGSGAFLVQCYRRLIEKEFPPTTNPRPTPSQLRELLQDHIFGMDNDPDACSVTELSLVLTLLDYVDPPDLEVRGKKPPLPSLRDQNIFHTNFFALSKPARTMLADTKFDWVVGNPPWKDLNPAKLSPQDEHVWMWMSESENKKSRPCGDNEVAQAFVWKSADALAPDGIASLLLPAMTLFEDPSRKFRSAFFRRLRITAVANFANLAEVLFAGRSRVAAAAFFFGHREVDVGTLDNEYVTVFSPLVANQEVTRPDGAGTRNETWSLLINANEIRDLPLAQIITGDGLPWKLATWGTNSDLRLLSRVAHRFMALRKLDRKFVSDGLFYVSEGPQLRRQFVKEGEERTEHCEEVEAKPVLIPGCLEQMRHVFAFPQNALETNAKNFLRVKGGRAGLAVCRPPHVIVSAARNFAVFSDEYLIMPPRQIGIVSLSDDRDLLKALSLYLSSDFAFYHQFLTATQFGVQRGRGTLKSLRTIPIPLANLGRQELKPWIQLHARLVKTTPLDVRKERTERQKPGRALPGMEDNHNDFTPLLKELNDLVNDTLGLDARDRALVHDLVRVRLELNDGKVGHEAVRKPEPGEMRTYAKRLKAELDAFIGDELPKRFQIGVVFDALSGMVQVDLLADKHAAREITIVKASAPTAKQLEETRQRLRRQHSQWVYFDRNLRLYEGTKTFVFKPMQRFHWTESQAVFDASEIIAETIQLGDDSL